MLARAELVRERITDRQRRRRRQKERERERERDRERERERYFCGPVEGSSFFLILYLNVLFYLFGVVEGREGARETERGRGRDK